MRNLFIATLLLLVAFSSNANSTTDMTDNNDAIVDIATSMGDIKVRLYGDTPHHRDNFLKLVKDGSYNGVLFHRVINNFMVQSGDLDSKNAPKGKMLGDGDPGYTIEAEIVYPKHFHKRGALAAAREGNDTNPEYRSSGSQFYIVTGKVHNDSTLGQIDKRILREQEQEIFRRLSDTYRDSIMTLRRSRDHESLEHLRQSLIDLTQKEVKENPRTIPADVREVYKTIGGTPHLDGTYTVFGEVIKGMDVIDSIQKVETDRNDRPVEDVRIISMKVE